jgi:hypothetical protein
MHQIIDEFLPKDEFYKLKNIIYGPNFPWFFQPSVEEPGVSDNNYCYYVHLLLNDGIQNSLIFNDIWDILKGRFDWKIIGRIKCNSYPSSSILLEHKNHVDAPWEHKGLILSMNTCDGATVLEDGTRIESIENRALFFDPSKPHHSTNCTNDKARVNININYF